MEELLALESRLHVSERIGFVGEHDAWVRIQQSAEQAGAALVVPDEEAERSHAREHIGIGAGRAIRDEAIPFDDQPTERVAPEERPPRTTLREPSIGL